MMSSLSLGDILLAILGLFSWVLIKGVLRKIVNKLFLKSFDTILIGNIKDC